MPCRCLGARGARLRARSHVHPGDQRFGGARADGSLALALVNTDPAKPARLAVTIAGARLRKVGGRVLTAPAMDAHNTF
jgi:alpha-N-arabinofuranosidase